MGPEARQEHLERMGEGYLRASRREKSYLLDEAVAVTVGHRKALIRRWRRAASPRRRRPGRPIRYGRRS